MNMKIWDDMIMIQNKEDIIHLKEKMIGLLNECDIHNIALHIIGNHLYDVTKLNQFLHSYQFTNSGNFIIK